MSGVTGIDLLFDPDQAGQEAAERVIELCETAEILHKNIKLPAALGDAGALTKNKVKELKERLYG